MLFGEIVFDDDFHKFLKIQNDDVKENDNFKNAKIYKIYKIVIYIGSACSSIQNVCQNLKENHYLK
jgi:hypothetical protein